MNAESLTMSEVRGWVRLLVALRHEAYTAEEGGDETGILMWWWHDLRMAMRQMKSERVCSISTLRAELNSDFDLFSLDLSGHSGVH